MAPIFGSQKFKEIKTLIVTNYNQFDEFNPNSHRGFVDYQATTHSGNFIYLAIIYISFKFIRKI